MNVKELKDELSKFDDEAQVKRIYGTLTLNGPFTGFQKRYMSHDLIAVIEDTNMNCLFLFEDL